MFWIMFNLKQETVKIWIFVSLQLLMVTNMAPAASKQQQQRPAQQLSIVSLGQESDAAGS